MRFDSKRQPALQIHYRFRSNSTNNVAGLISSDIDAELFKLDLELRLLLESSPACEFLFSSGFRDFISETASFFANRQTQLNQVEIAVLIWFGKERIEIKLQNKVVGVSNSHKSFETLFREENEVRVFKADNQFGGFDWVCESGLINEKKQEMENFSEGLYSSLGADLTSNFTGNNIELTLPRWAMSDLTPVPPNSPSNITESRAEPTPGHESDGRLSVLPDRIFSQSDLSLNTPKKKRVTFIPSP